MTPAPHGKPQGPSNFNWFNRLTIVAVSIVVAFTFLACLAMVGIFSAAFFEIFRGIRGLFDPLHGHGAAALESTIKGIELLFLAPLGFVVLRSLAGYLLHNGSAESRAGLISAKALVVGLLIAVLSSDLVGRILSRDLSPLNAAIEICAIVVLAAFYFLVEKLAD